MRRFWALLLASSIRICCWTQEATLLEWKTGTNVGDGTWNIIQDEDKGAILALTASGKPPKTPVRRPANLWVFPEELGDFQLDLQVKSLDIRKKGADVCLFFGLTDDVHYLYAHISNDSDNRVHQVIMNVDGTSGSRTTVHAEQDPPAPLNGTWQDVRLISTSKAGIQVYVDNMETPVLTAAPNHHRSGRIGVGSFNDRAEFRSMRLTRLESN